MAAAKTTNIPINTILIVFGILVNILIGATGLVGAIRNAPAGQGLYLGGDPNIATSSRNAWWLIFWASISLILLAIMGILAELHIAFIQRRFAIFSSYFSKAIWYALVGLLALGIAGDLGFATLVVCIIMVVVCVVLGFILEPPTWTLGGNDDSKV